MALLPFFRKKEETGGFPLDRLKKAKDGDETERNGLITEYRPFILRVTSETAGKYITAGEDDEFSIALQAFNEAISSFDLSKGSDFLKFSEQLIKWRLTDYFRKQSKQKMHEVSFEKECLGETLDESTDPRLAVEEKGYDQVDLKHQIIKLQKILVGFGISFSGLASSAPKHEDSRKLMVRTAKLMSQDPSLMALLHEKKELPVARLVEKTGLNRKTFYRNRDYLIALSIILCSEMEDIKYHILEMAGKEESI